MSNLNNGKNENEIDLLFLAKKVWNKRRLVFIIIVSFLVFGIIVLALMPSKDYEANASFILKSGENPGGLNTGSLGGLAALAGMNVQGMNSFSDGITPSLYPKLVSSFKFKKALIHAPINVSGYKQPMTYAQYYETIVRPSNLDYLKSYTIGIPSIIGSSFTKEPSENSEELDPLNDNIFQLSRHEIVHFGRLDKQMKVESKDGLIELSFNMPEALMAAQMAQYALELLQREVIAYKIGNAEEEYRFTENLYLEKKNDFEKIQNELGNFKDRNQNVITASTLNQLERLQTEYNLKFSVYTQMANSLETAKLQIAKDTPIFSIIDPVTVPTGKIGQNRFLIFMVLFILGVLIAVGYVIAFEFLNNVKDQWDQL